MRSWLIALILVFLPPGPNAQDCLYYQNYVQRPGYVDIGTLSGARGLDARGDLAYVANSTTDVEIIDVSDPSQPVRVASVAIDGTPTDVALIGDHACVVTPDQLIMLDISEPLAPTVVDQKALPELGGRTVVVAGDDAYIGGYRNMTRDTYCGWLQVVDLSNPTDPQFAGFVWMPTVSNQHSDARRIAIEGELAVVAARHAGIQLVDISNPDAPLIVGEVRDFGHIWNVDVTDGYIYAVGGGPLHVVDVTTPGDPRIVTSLEIACGHRGESIEIQDCLAYILCGDSYLHGIDLTQPEEPVDLGFVKSHGGPYAPIVVEDGTLLHTTREGMVAVDVSCTFAPAVVTQSTELGEVVIIDHFDDRTIAVDADGALFILDYHSPHEFDVIGTWHPPGDESIGPRDLDVQGDLAVLVGEEGLYLIDIADLADPVTAGRHGLPWKPYSAAISGDRVFATWGRFAGGFDSIGGLQVIDIRDPSAPKILLEKHYDAYVTHAEVYRDRLYLSVTPLFWGQLEIYDIRGPWAPILLQPAAVVPGSPVDLIFDGNTAFGAVPGLGMFVLDVADFASTRILGVVGDMMPGALALQENTLYVADAEAGIHVVDVEDRRTPQFLGTTGVCGTTWDVTILGDYVSTASGDAGLSFVRPQCDDRIRDGGMAGHREHPVGESSQATDLHLYPNPANPHVEIRFSVADERVVSIGIYNLKGARVRELESGIFGPGDHAAIWDGRDSSGRDLASGVYMVRVVAGKDVNTRKVMLVK